MPLTPEERAIRVQQIQRLEQREREDIERSRAACERFRVFAQQAWHIVEPSRPFVPGRHIDVICDWLQDYFDHGGGEDAVINQPPISGKSILSSVLWPAWIWAKRDPGHRFLCTAYSEEAVDRDAGRARELAGSPWFKARWPDASLRYDGSVALGSWSTRSGGWRISVPILGQILARHADTAIIDDPLSPNDARIASAGLAKAQTVIDDTITGRMMSPSTAHRLIVMQRLHEQDPAGVALSRGARNLVLPMRFEPDHPWKSSLDWRTRAGELLWPEFRPESDVLALERGFSPYARAGQLQQRPTPEGGGLFKSADATYTKKLPADAVHDGRWFISIDAAFKGKESSDPVAIGALCWHASKLYVAEALAAQLTFLATCAAIKDIASRWPQCHAKILEDAANGPAIADALEREVPGLVLIRPQGGKVARAHLLSALWEAHDVVLLEGAPWAPALVHELSSFPTGAHDDQVDMLSQAVNWAAGKGSPNAVPGLRAVVAGLGLR